MSDTTTPTDNCGDSYAKPSEYPDSEAQEWMNAPMGDTTPLTSETPKAAESDAIDASPDYGLDDAKRDLAELVADAGLVGKHSTPFHRYRLTAYITSLHEEVERLRAGEAAIASLSIVEIATLRSQLEAADALADAAEDGDFSCDGESMVPDGIDALTGALANYRRLREGE